MQTVTFSATATALSDLERVQMQDSAPYARGVGGVRVFARSTGTGDPATIEMVLVRQGVRLATFAGTVTPTAYRTDAAGTGGSYLCDVEFGEGGSSKFDLLGAEFRNGQCAPGLSGDDSGTCWMIGCSDLGDLTALTLELCPTTEV